MAISSSVLDNVRVASPCTVSWDTMAGDDRMRFCGQCRQHVFSLSELNRDKAEALLEETHGRLCVRFYQRADGTVMTRDCPESGRQTLRRWAGLALAAGLTLVVALVVWVRSLSGPEPEDRVDLRIRDLGPLRALFEWLDPTPPPPPPMVMGKLCPPQPPGPRPE